MPISTETSLSIEDLIVQYKTRKGVITPVDGVSLDVQKGECFGIAGESGCGKSTFAQAIINLLPSNAHITSGKIWFGDEDLVKLSERDYSDRIWGKEIIMIGQNPHDALNPVFKVGGQLAEILRTRDGDDESLKKQAKEKYLGKITKILTSMGIPDIDRVLSAYPHQLSGGMKQRMLIAMAFFCNPAVLIADEPTTALDATIAAQVVQLFRELTESSPVSIIYITHDIALLSELAQRIAVMYAGQVVETGNTDDIVQTPVHPYTRALLKALPSASKDRLSTIPGRVPDFLNLGEGCRFFSRCEHQSEQCRIGNPKLVEVTPATGCAVLPIWSDPHKRDTTQLIDVKDLKIYFSGRPRMFGRMKNPAEVVHAVDGVDFTIEEGEILSLVGESGCGKTTTGMGVLRLVDVNDGSITFRGEDVLAMGSRELRRFRRRAQMIFQATISSLDPRMTVREIMSEPLRIHAVEKNEDLIDEMVVETLEFMGLKRSDLDKFPHEFSGGQARRVGVARALVLRPEFIVADEPTSGLDVSVAAGILNLMRDLRDKLQLTYLWISHNLHAVSFVSDRIAVMYLGQIVEIATTKKLIEKLYHPYSKALFSAVPMINEGERIERIVLEGDIPSALSPPTGCRFHTRCNRRMPICSESEPQLREQDQNHFVRCHLYD